MTRTATCDHVGHAVDYIGGSPCPYECVRCYRRFYPDEIGGMRLVGAALPAPDPDPATQAQADSDELSAYYEAIYGPMTDDEWYGFA